MILFLKNKFSKYFDKLKYISLGGGMFSRMNPYLQEQLPFDIPSFNEYAETSIKPLSKYIEKKGNLK